MVLGSEIVNDDELAKLHDAAAHAFPGNTIHKTSPHIRHRMSAEVNLLRELI
jgi:hypothetical protein